MRSWLRGYFLEEDATFGTALVPMCFVSILLFTRHPLKTNFIFDEQEALLANPYVRSVADPASKIHWMDAFRRDFWGLLPDRSIGSYRPIPDMVWRALWALGAREQTPFLHHWVNVLLHGVNGALLTIIVQKATRDRATAWMSGVVFTACAVLTEAVSGVVGIADVLGALGVLLALAAVAIRPIWAMGLAVLVATSFGLYSKESALCAVPLVPFAVLMCARTLHPPPRTHSWLRAVVALVAAATAFVAYVEARRRLFPAHVPDELSAAATAHKGLASRAFAAVLRWFAQPILPRDPLNNPLVDATPLYRIAGGLRVYFRGLVQILFPLRLSGDYSAPQEPIPATLVFPESIAGALAMVVPLVAAPVLGVLAWRRAKRYDADREAADAASATGDAGANANANANAPANADADADADAVARAYDEIDLELAGLPVPDALREPADVRRVIGVALVWIVVSYFPVSNIPVLLPTVRAERFWYFPALGTAVLIGIALVAMLRAARWPSALLVLAFLGFQSWAARAHANDYTDDLVFWDATRRAVPRSAKAHLNYSVMQGARGNLEERRRANEVALSLAPKWPMANVYLGDTLCRMHRAPEALPHYLAGFEMAPNDQNLIALGVQCLWDEKQLGEGSLARDELSDLADKHPSTWLAYIARDTIDNGEQHNGVDPKYRPRGYNEGPKGD